MSRVLCIPDPHLKIEVIENGLELADKLMCDKVVILGDFYDDFGSTVTDYEDMALYIKTILRRNPDIIPLYGNHELSYMGFKCSGYREDCANIVRKSVENNYRFLFAVSIDGVLYSHAGITQSWVRGNKLLQENTIRYHMGKRNGSDKCEQAINGISRIDVLAQAGPGRGGKSYAGPLWSDLSELVPDQLGKFTQVVGHTPVESIEKYGNCYFTDVFSNDNQSDEYLYVVDGEPQIVHYNEVIYGEKNKDYGNEFDLERFNNEYPELEEGEES